MSSPFTLGWEEWVSLPKLGLPAIKAKVDTGARTSALHASVIEPFGPIDKPQVRFLIQPDPDDLSLEFTCSAPVVDRRQVTSSNGEAELRYVIQTDLTVGERTWPVEMTLSNRESMQYRMLFGRTSIADDMVVDPNQSFAQGKLSFDVYKGLPKRRPVRRPLRIALLTKEPFNYSSRRLVEAGEARGHVVETIDTTRCYMKIDAHTSEAAYGGGGHNWMAPAPPPSAQPVGRAAQFQEMPVPQQQQFRPAVPPRAPAAIPVAYATQPVAYAQPPQPPPRYR